MTVVAALLALLGSLLALTVSWRGPAQAVPPAADSDWFSAGLVSCKVLRARGDRARAVTCNVRYTSDPYDLDGDRLVVLRTTGAAYPSPGRVDSTPGHQELDLGETKNIGGIVCTALEQGVSCVNRRGRGFVVLPGRIDRRGKVTRDRVRSF